MAGVLARLCACAGIASTLLVAGVAPAQVVTDGTLHPSLEGVAVELGPGSTWTIGEDLGRREGGNLFHSFERLDVPARHTALFTGPSDVDHVVARVTGGVATEIAGTLRSSYAGADLLLVNPSGVAIAPGAVLDVPGALRISTADYVKLGEDGRFDAADPSRDALSMAPPSAFGFLDAPAPIAVGGERPAPVQHGLPGAAARASLSIVGGDITIGGNLDGNGGEIEIVSVGGAGEAPIATLTDADFDTMGRVRVTGRLRAQRFADDGAQIRIRAGRLEVDDGEIFARTRNDGDDGGGIAVYADDVVLADGGRIEATNSGLGAAPRIDVESARLAVGTSDGRGARIEGSALGPGGGAAIRIHATESVAVHAANDPGGIFSNASDNGPAGSIEIETSQLTLADRGRIGAASSGAHDAGSVAIAAGRVDVTGGAQIRVESSDAGAVGSVAIRARDTVRMAGRVVSSGDEPYFERSSGIVASSASTGGGNVRVEAGRLELDDAVVDARARGAGAGTRVELEVGSLELAHGGVIDTTTDGAGHGGDIAIRASERVAVSGSNAPLDVSGCRERCPTTLRISDIRAATTGPGDAGSIRIEAPLLHLFDRGAISAFTGENGALDGNVDPATVPGRGGAIEIEVGELLLGDNGLIQTSSSWLGRAGSISVRASRSIEIVDAVRDLNDIDQSEAGLQSRTFGPGPGGSIRIEAPALHIAGGTIETSASALPGGRPATGDGGDVELHVGRLLLDGWGRVRSVSEAAGDAGRVTVLAGELVSIQGPGAFGVVPGISTSAFATGDGGSIAVTAPSIRIAGGGEITARSSGIGDAGDIALGGGVLAMQGGSIATSATSGDGGNVTLTFRDTIHLVDSLVTASVGSGQGGNVTIDPELVLLERSAILAQAAEGRGGAIRITSDLFFASDSLISASAGPAGIGGSVVIESPDTDRAIDVELLPATFLDAASLLRERCAARGGARASLYVVESPSAPQPPSRWLASPRAEPALRLGAASLARTRTPACAG